MVPERDNKFDKHFFIYLLWRFKDLVSRKCSGNQRPDNKKEMNQKHKDSLIGIYLSSRYWCTGSKWYTIAEEDHEILTTY